MGNSFQETSSLEKSKDVVKEKIDIKPKENKGIILKKERLSQKLSLQDIHEATKIPLDALKAIEEGYNVKILTPFYIRGFIKIYANYLNLDLNNVFEDYKAEELPKHENIEVEAFDLNQWITNNFTKERKQKIVIIIAILLSLFIIYKIVGFIAYGINKNSDRLKIKVENKKNIQIQSKIEEPKFSIKVKKEPEDKAIKKASDQEKVIPKEKGIVKKEIKKQETKIISEDAKIAAPLQAKSTAVQPIITGEPQASRISIKKDVVLTVRAQKNSWLNVKVDGNIVFQSTLQLGAVETWMADKEIEISGKNIGSLELELNGKMIGLLSRKERRANKIVITKEGLSVIQ